LKLIREGLEDYEYLTLLSMKAGTLHTTELVNTLVHKTYDYERDPEKMYALRRRIGEELSR
jgi:hypothetical protein